MELLPMVSGCALDEAALRRQGERYGRVGHGARLADRTRRSAVIELGAQVDATLIDDTIAIERECCPFFTLEWDADRRRLTVSVSEAEHEPTLDAVVSALGLDGSAPDSPTA